MKVVKYNLFKESLFPKLTIEEKNTLFYWSLLDPSGWQEINIENYYPDVNSGHSKIIKILSKNPPIKRIISKNKSKFVKNFINGEFLINYLIAAQLEDRLTEESWRVNVREIEKRNFPDIVFERFKEEKIEVEIKSLLSASELKRRVEDEIKPKLNAETNKNFLLVLLFSVFKQEISYRINQLIEGYYVYEEIIFEDGCSRKVLCQACSEDYTDSEHTFAKLINRIEHFFGEFE